MAVCALSALPAALGEHTTYVAGGTFSVLNVSCAGGVMREVRVVAAIVT